MIDLQLVDLPLGGTAFICFLILCNAMYNTVSRLNSLLSFLPACCSVCVEL